MFLTAGLILGLWSSIEGYLGQHPYMASVVGSLSGAVFTVFAAWLIANRYTKRIKRVDATLEFSKRYHELLADAVKVNESYARNDSASFNDKTPGYEWWVRFFDLMQFEYHFYRHGLILPETFEQWMWWRHYDYAGDARHQKVVTGIKYTEGWTYYRSLPALKDNAHIHFMDLVHGASSQKSIRRVVRWHRFLVVWP